MVNLGDPTIRCTRNFCDALQERIARQLWQLKSRRHPRRHLQFTLLNTRVGPILQAARHRRPGHWRPLPVYADDVGLLDWTAAAEASERVSLLARGSRTSASMDMSAPKLKGMHVHIRERLPVSTDVEVDAVDLPHSCPECDMTFPTTRGLAVHRARWCRPGQRPASGWGQIADKAVKLVKRKASAALLPPVVIENESLESVYLFDHLGFHFTSDRDDAADMRHDMVIGGERSRSLDCLWRDNRLPRSLKLHLYAACVCSALAQGSGAWMRMPRALATRNGFNSRKLQRITGRSYH